MVEEHIYFIVYASRWIEEHNWQVTKAANFSGIPTLLRGFITKMVRKGAIAQVKGQGMGRHSAAERLARFETDIDAIETLLGDQDYLFGDKPTAADISTITALSFARAFTGPNELNDYLATKPKLNAYIDRGRQVLFPK